MSQTPKGRLDPTASQLLQGQSSSLPGVMVSADTTRPPGNWGCLDGTDSDFSILAAAPRAHSTCSVNVH